MCSNPWHCMVHQGLLLRIMPAFVPTLISFCIQLQIPTKWVTQTQMFTEQVDLENRLVNQASQYTLPECRNMHCQYVYLYIYLLKNLHPLSNDLSFQLSVFISLQRKKRHSFHLFGFTFHRSIKAILTYRFPLLFQCKGQKYLKLYKLTQSPG